MRIHDLDEDDGLTDEQNTLVAALTKCCRRKVGKLEMIKMFGWIRNWWRSGQAAVVVESAVRVEDVSGIVTITYPDGVAQSISWDDLQLIEIHTNDSGPWGADVWWVLSGKSNECKYPQGATGDSKLLEKYQALKGFNNEEVIKAMGSTSNKKFICWVSPDAT